MDPIPGARETWTYVPTEKAEQPQYDQNDDDDPKQGHEISPFRFFKLFGWGHAKGLYALRMTISTRRLNSLLGVAVMVWQELPNGLPARFE